MVWRGEFTFLVTFLLYFLWGSMGGQNKQNTCFGVCRFRRSRRTWMLFIDAFGAAKPLCVSVLNIHMERFKHSYTCLFLQQSHRFFLLSAHTASIWYIFAYIYLFIYMSMISFKTSNSLYYLFLKLNTQIHEQVKTISTHVHIVYIHSFQRKIREIAER